MRSGGDVTPLPWRREGLRINAYGAALRRRFGGRVQRVSVDAGFTCPNVDGTVTRGGCVFCDNRSFSPSRRGRLRAVLEQLEAGMAAVRRRYGTVAGYIAYFQPATNTYAPVDQLEELFTAAARHENVVGLAIGTRPDCVPDAVLELVDQLAADRYVSLEYGMQSIHDRSLDWMNRGHHHAAMVDAMRRSRGRRFETCAHVILGIPGEEHCDMMATAEALTPLGVDAVKIHNLYAVRGTPLGDQVLSGEVRMMSRQQYLHTVVDFLERMAPEMIVERVSGDAPPDFLIAPRWCADKAALRCQIEAEFDRRGTRQGSRWVGPAGSLSGADGEEGASEQASDQTPPAILRHLAGSRTLPVLRFGGGPP